MLSNSFEIAQFASERRAAALEEAGRWRLAKEATGDRPRTVSSVAGWTTAAVRRSRRSASLLVARLLRDLGWFAHTSPSHR
ncbi:MAG: hypothetical protein KatS3mg060_1821 [Dehalococcoidia bacterium]|nr:MAG: hypothetical protein KatS3mg060_1821 [Dehalococcoidia bacterium]